VFRVWRSRRALPIWTVYLLRRKWTRSTGIAGAVMTISRINLQAASSVIGAVTETPIHDAQVDVMPSKATIDDRVLLVAKKLQADPDLLAHVEYEIYQRSLATLGG